MDLLGKLGLWSRLARAPVGATRFQPTAQAVDLRSVRMVSPGRGERPGRSRKTGASCPPFPRFFRPCRGLIIALLADPRLAPWAGI
jgi:hypothetical protein